MANDKKPAATLTLDEEAPQTLQLDEPASGDAEKITPENTPGLTAQGAAKANAAGVKFQKPTKFETDNKIPENYGFTVGNIANNAWEGAKGLVKSGATAAYDFGLG